VVEVWGLCMGSKGLGVREGVLVLMLVESLMRR
jgi:hypothetical protein